MHLDARRKEFESFFQAFRPNGIRVPLSARGKEVGSLTVLLGANLTILTFADQKSTQSSRLKLTRCH